MSIEKISGNNASDGTVNVRDPEAITPKRYATGRLTHIRVNMMSFTLMSSLIFLYRIFVTPKKIIARNALIKPTT
jgi:hypothetical protein